MAYLNIKRACPSRHAQRAARGKREVRAMKRLVEKGGEDMSARKWLYFAKMQNNSSI